METRLPLLCFTLELGNLSLKRRALGKSPPSYGGVCAREGMLALETPRASAPVNRVVTPAPGRSSHLEVGFGRNLTLSGLRERTWVPCRAALEY